MKKKLIAIAFITGLALFGIAGMAQAALVTIGTATYGGSDYNLIWDDDNNGNSVVWLDYSNASTNWSSQNTWAAGLDGNLTYNIDAAYNVSWEGNWRLGNTVDGEYVYGYDGSTTAGYNITSSEMGHLFYEELGNLGYYDTSGEFQPGYGLQNTGDFNHLIAFRYWSSTECAYNTNLAWMLNMGDSYQGNGVKNTIEAYGLALRSGQVSSTAPVPVPPTIFLLGSGLLGLIGIKARKKKS